MADSSRKKALFILSQLNNDDIDWIVQKGKKESSRSGRRF